MRHSRRNGPGTRDGGWLLRGVQLGILVLGLGACAGAPVATLSGVVVNGELATGSQMDRIRIIRSDRPLSASQGMVLRKGDTISTSADTEAILIFDEEWELGLDSETTVYISNPRAWLERGRVFVRKLRDRAREVFEVEDEHHVLAASGTEFVLETAGPDAMTVSVLEDSVRVAPKAGDWEPVTYGPLERGRLAAGEPPERMESLTAGEAEALRAFVRRIEEITTLRVPEVEGLSQDVAVATLDRSGLRVGDVSTRLTGEAAEGSVLTQSPVAGVEVRAGTAVDLVVEGAGVRVPGVVGAAREDAERRLAAAGLSVSVREVESDEENPGTVLSQSPDPRALVERGTRVALTVAVTPSPVAVSPREPEPCVVPELEERTEEEARRLLEEAGLSVGEITRLRYDPDRVSGQAIEAGSRVRCGTRVDFTLGVIG